MNNFILLLILLSITPTDCMQSSSSSSKQSERPMSSAEKTQASQERQKAAIAMIQMNIPQTQTTTPAGSSYKKSGESASQLPTNPPKKQTRKKVDIDPIKKLEKKREYYHRYRKEHPDQIKASNEKYRKEHPDQKRESDQKYRAKKKLNQTLEDYDRNAGITQNTLGCLSPSTLKPLDRNEKLEKRLLEDYDPDNDACWPRLTSSTGSPTRSVSPSLLDGWYFTERDQSSAAISLGNESVLGKRPRSSSGSDND